MADTNNEKLETRYYKLEKLVKWQHIDELNQMLLSGVMNPRQAAEWCKERGFVISHPKLYEYRELLRKAVAQNITVERLLGIGLPKRVPIQLAALGAANAKQYVKNELEVLDAIIQRGFNALASNPEIKLQDALRAIELKNKLTGGAHGGFTTYGLDRLHQLEEMKIQAMVEVVTKYLPEDKIPELEEALAKAEEEFYHEYAPELLDEWKRSNEEIEKELEQKDK